MSEQIRREEKGRKGEEKKGRKGRKGREGVGKEVKQIKKIQTCLSIPRSKHTAGLPYKKVKAGYVRCVGISMFEKHMHAFL